VTRLPCDVCGEHEHIRELTAADRASFPSVASWIRRACSTCLKRFERNV
jgi:hypothetical protein